MTTARKTRRRVASLPAPRPIAVATGSVLLASMVLLAGLAMARPRMDLSGVVPETYVAIERAQVVVWIVSGVLAGAAAFGQRRIGGLLLSSWLGVLALLAGLRELDLHVLLNPGNIGVVGLAPEQAVRFRLDWWADPSTPAGLKLAWAAVFVLVLTLAVLPFALARFPWFGRVLARDAFALPVVAGFGLIVATYGIDDFLARPLDRRGIEIGLVEEGLELLGQCVLLVGLGVLLSRSIRFGGPEPA